MAVKQNNTDANDAPAAVGANNGGGAATTVNGVKSTTAVGAKKKILSHDAGGGVGAGGGGGGVSVGNAVNAADISETLNCTSSVNKVACTMQNNASIGISGDSTNCSKPKSELENLLMIIDAVEARQKSHGINSIQEMLVVYQRIIFDLSRLQIRQTAEELKLLKGDIAKVGVFLAKPNELRVYLLYLRIVCQLITESPLEPPSCAVAIVFQLFSTEQIIEAVQSLLSHNIPDASIRKTIALLCDWVRFPNICQNLNLWIMAILGGLYEQEKYLLLDEISLDNIEKLFALLILPALRNKVSPIVFHMLSTIQQAPEIFLKIVPKIPTVVNLLKTQLNRMDDYDEDTKNCIQKLVDIASALMVRFEGYDERFYEPVELAFKNYEPSYNYLRLVNGDKNDDDDLSNLLQNNSNARVGLVNLGNTCYMNSVLQALAMTKEFSRELLLIESTSPLLLKMQQQIALMHYSARYEITPTRVLVATRPPGFSPGLQQDSSEFLGYLLDVLHEQEVAYQPKQKLGAYSNNAGGAAAAAAAAAAAIQLNEAIENGVIPYGNTERTSCTSTNSTLPNTPTKGTNQSKANTTTTTTTRAALEQSTIEKTFSGKLATTYKCLNCGWQSRNVDSFRDLQLSFPEAKNDCSASNYSVQDLVDYYCSPEKLDGDNQYFCEQCKRLTDAERFISVIGAPKNLILTLKHFKYDQKYHMRAKLMHKVFHDEKVTVKVCSTDAPDEIVHYDLYAGVVHSGFSMDSGHYYTYAADETNKWYKFNDNIVTHSKSEELHNLTPPNTPYILFYQMSARSNETSEAAACSKVVKIEIPLPLTLNELPRQLRDYINHDNGLFNEELKMRRFKHTKQRTNGGTNNNRYNNDDDDEPPPSSCGGNALNMNMNRFVF